MYREKKPEKQAKFDLLITDLEKTVSESRLDYTYFKGVLETQLKSINHSENNYFRMVHSIITVLGQKKLPADQPDVLANWLFYYFCTLNCEINPPYATEMVETLEIYVKSVDPTDENDVRVRNICLALSILLSRIYRKDKKIKKIFTAKMATFLEKVVIHNSKYSQLFALLCLTLFCEVDELKTYLSKQLNIQAVFRQLSSTVEEFKNLESMYNPEHVLRYRIGTIAQWMLDHDVCVDESLQVKDCTAIKLLTVNTYRIKVTRDNFSAFGCDRIWQDYQCSQGIDPKNGDVFYYEAIHLTPGSIWLGWALKIEARSAVFPTKESISYNSYQKKLRVCGVSENYDLPSIKPCDVVGCLLDTSAGAFKFFLNGNEIPHTWTLPQYKLDLSSELYYPTVCLSAYQQVYFNFGQAPFRFAPTDVKFRAICGEVHITVEEKFNLWITDLEKAISERCFGYFYFKDAFEPSLRDMADKKCFSRLVHSTVNVLGQKKLPTDNPEVIAYWLYYSIDVLNSKIYPPDAEEMRQILDTHMEAVDSRNDDDVRVRNISMLLAILISKIYTEKEELKTLFNGTVAKFVEDVVKYNSSYAQLFALICLETYSTVNELNAPNHLHLKETLAQLSKLLETSLEKCRAQSDDDVLPSRIGEYSQWLLDQVFDDNKSLQIKEDSTIIKLCTTKDRQIIFTRDNYSAFGCDCLWQDYQCSHGIDPASGDVFYYEATLFTRGSIYIGWALKLDFEKHSDEFSSKKSVSLNIFNNKTFVEALGLSCTFDLPFPIKPCGVVGCLLDTLNGTFKFYLNGSEILHSFTLPEYKLEMPSDELYPTASLSLYQHVYFNFGQVPFRFAPTDVKFCTVLDVFNTSQEKFDSWIFRLEKTVSESCLDESYFESAFETPLKEMIVKSGEKGVYRLVHATVNVLGQKKFFTDQPDKLLCLLHDYFSRTRLWLGFVAFPVVEMAKILETHLEAVDPTDKHDVRVRNITMLLRILISINYTKKNESKAIFTKKIVTFIEDVVIHNCNYAQLFALMCLENYSVEVDKQKSFKQLNLEVVLYLRLQAVEEFKLESLYNRGQSYVLGYRIGVNAQWLLDHVFGDGNLHVNNSIKLLTDEEFDSKKKVTRDNFSAFENFNSRQVYQCSQRVDLQSGDVFYYEAILFTSGAIHVGWALKMDKRIFYKSDIFENFVSFNAFKRTIVTCGEEEGSFDLPPIKPCDVVGCLLDSTAGTFKFYLNGNEIPHTFTLAKCKLNMTSEHYYPTVCLAAYQQVYFNFGQAPFRFAPSDVKFRSIWELSNTLEEGLNRWILDLEKAASKCLDSSAFHSLTSSLEEMALKSDGQFISLLAQTIITQLGQDISSTSLLDSFAFLLFRHLKSKLISPDAAQMAQTLGTYLKAVDPKDTIDIRVRNICLLLTILAFGFYNDAKKLKALFTEKIISFVGDVVAHNCKYAQLFALMCLEKCNVVGALKSFKQSNLVVVLRQLSQAVEEFKPESVYNSDYMTILKIQQFRNGAYAQWLLDHVFGDGCLQMKDCAIKLLTSNKFDRRKKVTRDNLSAFGCDNLWQNYQCSYGIDPQSGDMFYYEVILFTKGSIYVGWALKIDFAEEYAEFYGNKDSISFESLGKVIRAYGEENSCDLPVVPFELYNVVGCLLDTSTGTFKFYLNGREISHSFTQSNYKLNMTSGHYYPTVRLAAYQQVYFNFGQAPFRFSPPGVKFRTVLDVIKSNRKYKCGGMAMETSLVKPVNSEKSEDYLKVQASTNKCQVPSIATEISELVDCGSGVSNSISNTKQEKINEWIRKLELRVRENVIHDEEVEGELRKTLLELVKCDEDWIKLGRSMITEMSVSADDRVDVMAMWMMSYIKLLMPPKPDKVMKLIKPYLESYVNENVAVSNEISTQLRNICMLLSIMPRVYQYEKKLKVFLTSKIINVLVKLVSPTNQHKSSKLYALFCIQSFAKSCPQMKCLLKNIFKREDFETSLQVQITESTSNSFDYDLCQINFLSVWLLDYVFEKDNLESIASKTTSGASTKMSTAGFYYYDWVDYSYQSGICVPPVSCSVYFFEAILMTSGSARVGWALSSDDRKGNAQCSSIFFDAYQKCIYLDGKPHPIEKTLKQPKPGTVIGCLLDTAFQIFYFYLDGDLVPVSEVKLCLSTKSYFPTVSLAAYQHVGLNLGQSSFKYPLKGIQRRKVKKAKRRF